MKKEFSEKGRRRSLVFALVALLGLALPQAVVGRHAWADSLPSWNDGTAKAAIVDFATRDTKGGADFVPAAWARARCLLSGVFNIEQRDWADRATRQVYDGNQSDLNAGFAAASFAAVA